MVDNSGCRRFKTALAELHNDGLTIAAKHRFHFREINLFGLILNRHVDHLFAFGIVSQKRINW